MWVLALPRITTHVSHAWTSLALRGVGCVDSLGPSLALSRRIHARFAMSPLWVLALRCLETFMSQFALSRFFAFPSSLNAYSSLTFRTRVFSGFRVGKRRGCIFSRSPFVFVEAHPRALSVVTSSGFGTEVLRDVCEPICPVLVFGFL